MIFGNVYQQFLIKKLMNMFFHILKKIFSFCDFLGMQSNSTYSNINNQIC